MRKLRAFKPTALNPLEDRCVPSPMAAGSIVSQLRSRAAGRAARLTVPRGPAGRFLRAGRAASLGAAQGIANSGIASNPYAGPVTLLTRPGASAANLTSVAAGLPQGTLQGFPATNNAAFTRASIFPIGGASRTGILPGTAFAGGFSAGTGGPFSRGGGPNAVNGLSGTAGTLGGASGGLNGVLTGLNGALTGLNGAIGGLNLGTGLINAGTGLINTSTGVNGALGTSPATVGQTGNTGFGTGVGVLTGSTGQNGNAGLGTLGNGPLGNATGTGVGGALSSGSLGAGATTPNTSTGSSGSNV